MLFCQAIIAMLLNNINNIKYNEEGSVVTGVRFDILTTLITFYRI